MKTNADALRNDRAPLYCHYQGQTEAQGAYLEVDYRNRTLTATYNGEIGNAIPFSLYHNHETRINLPNNLTGKTVAALLEDAEIQALAEAICDGYSSEWDGHNHVGQLDADATQALAALEQMISDRYDEPSESEASEVWSVGDWLDPSAYAHRDSTPNALPSWRCYDYVNIDGVGTIRHDTTDETLAEMAAKIEEGAEADNVVLDGDTEKLLREWRDGCEKPDDED